MGYVDPPQDGQATMANSSPVVIASDQTAVPVTDAALAGFLDTVETLIAATNTALGTIDGRVDGLEGLLTTLNGYSDTLETLLGTLNSNVDGLEGFSDGIETLIGSTNTALTTLAGYTDTLETLIGTTNTNLTTLSGHVDGLETLITTLNGYVDTLETLLAGTLTVGGNVAHDAPDSGNPVKVGGKAITSAPTAVAHNDRVDAIFDPHGRQLVGIYSPELNQTGSLTSLRDFRTAQRYTVLADSLADGLASFWTATTANSATATSTGGEGVLDTTASATGSAQLTSTTINYLPGQVTWFNSAARFNDTGSAGNTRRIGMFTVSGTTPQEGAYFELSGTTLNAVVVKSGTPSATASTSWSRVADSPFTLDTSYHSFELHVTANRVDFLVDNVVRHSVVGTTSPITTTLNFPITIQSINTSGATSRLIAVRNCGIGRFGTPPDEVGGVGSQPKYATIAASSSGNNTVVAASTGKKIRVLAAQLVSNGTVNAKWQSGAGGTDLTGLAYLVANSGYALPYNPAGWFETASATLLNLNLSAAVAVGGSITYLEV